MSPAFYVHNQTPVMVHLLLYLVALASRHGNQPESGYVSHNWSLVMVDTECRSRLTHGRTCRPIINLWISSS